MIRITAGNGNGYYCGCCRSTYTNTHDYETMEEAIKAYTRIHFLAKEEDEDIWVENIAEVRDIELEVDKAHYEVLKQDLIARKEKDKKETEERERKEKERMFAQLQKELGK